MNADPFVLMSHMFASIDWNSIFIGAAALLGLGIGIAMLIAGFISILDTWRLTEQHTTAKVVAKCREREHATEDWKFHPVAQMPMLHKQYHLEAFILQVDAGWGPTEVQVPRDLYHKVESGDEIKIAYVRSRIKAEPRLTRVVGEIEVER